MLKIAITGANGRMGKTIVSAGAEDRTISITALLQKEDKLSDTADFATIIDFSSPEASLKYLDFCVKNNKKIVIGTTGFSNQQLTIINNYAKSIPIVFAPNMSIGINLMLKLVTQSAKTIGKDSDIEIIETHHKYKLDAPSGTALKLGEVIANALGRDFKQCATYSRFGITSGRAKNTIGFAVVRGGDSVGEHSVVFFMDGEQITINHKATSRITFAKGAIKAAHWLNNKSKGLYSMHDVLNL